jgi:lipopolysaccharide biosynthesis glycosyltransferase
MLTEGNTGQYVDVMENRPHSVDFSFTRFLVPIIAKALGINGYVMFADCDFLFLTDLNKLFLELNGSYSNRPVAVVKHEFPTYTENKMDGCKQLSYTKKLWSAFMCFNTNHPDLEFLTIGNINKVDGMWLHGFKWLPDESAIVGLPEYYQYIPDHSEKNIDAPPRIIHYTEKAPWFNGPIRSCGWSDFWWDEVAEWKKAVASTGRNERFWE